MVDAAFQNAGQAVGVEIWRIEKLAPVKQQDPELFGKFYTGDSYIVLNTLESKTGTRSWNVHFWLGAETSQDEQGVAAYKTVELDDSLGGAPIQYRESQFSESEHFLSMFKKTGGIEYLSGGVDSGFTHVDRDSFPTRLLHVKGKRTVVCKEVPVAGASLNRGDVFVLDMGLKLYYFCGDKAAKQEKFKGLETCTQLNASRGNRCEIIWMQKESETDPGPSVADLAAFWDALGGELDVSALPEGEPDDAPVPFRAPEVYRITDDNAANTPEFIKCEVQLIKNKLDKNVLDGNDVFLVDCAAQIFVWVGRGSTVREKKESMAFAVKYIADRGYPASTRVERLMEGHESNAFTGCFYQFGMSYSTPANFTGAVVHSVAAKKPDPTIDIGTLMANAQESDHVDMSTHKNTTLIIYRIENFQKVEIAKENYGMFYSGDSYIVDYTYEDSSRGNRRTQLIYFWLGATSTSDEKGAAALLTKELDDQAGGSATQIRVTQGKEPSHFKQLFNNCMVVFTGGCQSGFKNTMDEDSYDVDGTGMFHIRGSTCFNIAAVQVEEEAANLNSADVFVLVTPTNCFVWNGQGSCETERSVGVEVGNLLATSYMGVKTGRLVVNLVEGEETEEFWSSLKGGKQEYPSFDSAGERREDIVPRLFHMSTATGCFNVTEIYQFDQEDLMNDDVMLLDAGAQGVFIWIGGRSSDEEKEKSFSFAHKYLEHQAGDTGEDVTICLVRAGSEPPMFTTHFINWDPLYFQSEQFLDPYAGMACVRSPAAEAAAAGAADTPAAGEGDSGSGVTPTRTRKPLVVARTEPVSYLNMRSSDMSSKLKAENANAFAFVSPQAGGAGGPAVKAAPSSTSYLNTRTTDMSSKLKAENANAFAFVSPQAGGASPPPPPAAAELPAIPASEYLEYDVLSGEALPAGVDVHRKEEYLFDEDFVEIFSCDKAAFKKLPKWKRDAKKKEVKLF